MKVLRELSRVYLEPEDLQRAVSFYEWLLGEECRLRFAYPEVGLELAQVSSVLLVAGSESALRPFRDTQMTFLVDSLQEFEEELSRQGARIIEHPRRVPTGRNMRVVHPDGAVVEYVEHDG